MNTKSVKNARFEQNFFFFNEISKKNAYILYFGRKVYLWQIARNFFFWDAF